jgi:peptide/nickel transport system permease protein
MPKFWRLLRQQPVVAVAASIAGLFLFTATFGPWIAPYGCAEMDTAELLSPPSRKHLLGTDQSGQDVPSRIVVGSRDDYLVSDSSAIIAVLLV